MFRILMYFSDFPIIPSQDLVEDFEPEVIGGIQLVINL